MHYGRLPRHIAEGLLTLRQRIDRAEIPPSMLDESLNVATWNIRVFGSRRRLRSSIYFIAEILNQFDLIALTELRDNLGDLQRVMMLLGPQWQIVFSDFTGDRGGNSERIAYLFDTRMVRFTGLAAEADPPRRKAGGEWLPKYSWWRAPYMASFQAGNFDFVLLTAHMRWGDDLNERIDALAELGKWVARRRKKKYAVDKDFVVMGDFNIPKQGDRAYRALTGDGEILKMPASLAQIPGTNLSQRHNYDQILHSPTNADRFSNAGGVLDFYRDDWEALYPDRRYRPKDRRAFTYQLSDHLPLWLQINTDIVDEHLQVLAGKGSRG